MTIDDLLEAVTKATAEPGTLSMTIGFAEGRGWIDRWTGSRALRMLDAGAGLQAMMLLTPPGYTWHVWSINDGLPCVELKRAAEPPIFGLDCKTEALNFAQAVLKARKTME